jgi:hypothetical protein
MGDWFVSDDAIDMRQTIITCIHAGQANISTLD